MWGSERNLYFCICTRNEILIYNFTVLLYLYQISLTDSWPVSYKAVRGAAQQSALSVSVGCLLELILRLHATLLYYIILYYIVAD